MTNILGNLFGPLAPGVSPTINPVSMLGAGMYSGNPAAALAQMGRMQQAGQQLALNQQMQQQKLAMLQAEARREAEERTGQQRAAMALVNPIVGMLGPGVLEEQRQALTTIAQGSPETLLSAYASGKGPFEPSITPSSVRPGTLGREEALKELNLEDYSTESVQNFLTTGASTGSYDPSLLQTKPTVYGFGEERKLAAEVRKDLLPVRAGVTKGLQLLSTLEQPGPISDVASLYGLVGTLDPSSVIRESETALVQSAIGLADRLKSLGQQAAGQGFITNDMRTEMRDVAKRLMQIYKDEYDAQSKYWKGVSESYKGISPERVMGAPIDFPDLTIKPRLSKEKIQSEKDRIMKQYLPPGMGGQ